MTDIELVRLLIGDVTPVLPALPYYTDIQIQAFLTLAGDAVYLAAALALEAWAATLTDNVDSESIGDYSYSKKSASNKLELAKRYREDESATPVLDWAGFNLTDTEDE